MALAASVTRLDAHRLISRIEERKPNVIQHHGPGGGSVEHQPDFLQCPQIERGPQAAKIPKWNGIAL